MEQSLTIGSQKLKSRLIVGTGKYDSMDLMIKALDASGADTVTVALRRIDLNAGPEENLLHHIDRKRYRLLPNTAGCYCAKDAIQVAELSREAGIGIWVKLEILGSEKTLLPDVSETLDAARYLVKEGFEVLAYTNDDPVTAMRLQDIGVVAVMPLGAPIGSGRGILNPLNIRFIVEQATVPVIVDAGVGCASDVSFAMELGIDGVLLNTGIAGAKDPVKMAEAMNLACRAGRKSWQAGRISKKEYAAASSPKKDF